MALLIGVIVDYKGKAMIDQYLDKADVIVVGAGLFGSTVVDRIKHTGLNILVLESRPHVGGNCHDYQHYSGINVHSFGPHIFHTSNQQVWDYVRGLSEFNSYAHQCRSSHEGRLYSMPINLDTINRFFGRDMTPSEAEQWMAQQRVDIPEPANFTEQIVSQIGWPLYRAFFEGYTRKQWGREPEEIPATVGKRLPVRFSYSSRYYRDTWEGIPMGGYRSWFSQQLAGENVRVCMLTDWFELRNRVGDKPVIYTGPIDRFFDYAEGDLAWRTLDFEFEELEQRDFQGVTQVNYPGDKVPWTRIIEYKHFHPEAPEVDTTVISREFSRTASRQDQPYYPVKTVQDMSCFRRYQERAKSLPNVIMGGRLAEYQYYDMHQVMASAFTKVDREIMPLLRVKYGIGDHHAQ
jgi:UDP-galactopyranose mutase